MLPLLGLAQAGEGAAVAHPAPMCPPSLRRLSDVYLQLGESNDTDLFVCF